MRHIVSAGVLSLYCYQAWGLHVTRIATKMRFSSISDGPFFGNRHAPVSSSSAPCRSQIHLLSTKSSNLHGRHKEDQEIQSFSSGSNDTSNSLFDVDVDSVSEAEALLACRAYLQRKNRLGEWHAWQARKELREEAKALGLRYDTYISDASGSTDGVDIDKTTSSSPVSPFSQPLDESTPRFDGFQSTWNGGPSGSSLRRSEAAKLRWANPEFRSRWYERRWGGREPKKRSNKEKILEERVRALKPELFLANPLVGAMTEDEIAEAIRVYVISRRKISVARKKMAEARKTGEPASPSPQEPSSRASLFFSDPEMQAQKRKERAEHAKQRYQKRLENQEKQSASSAAGSAQPTRRRASRKILQAQRPSGSTPRDAMARINVDLDANSKPAVEDVKLVLQAQRLSNRRQLLVRILRDCFGLRGKCVPLDVTDETSKLTFATSAPMELVGALVLHKLREAQ